MNAAGLDLLKHYEGFSASAYLDPVGVPTIGFGFTTGVKLGDTMTMAQALARLNDELEPRERALALMCLKPANENQHAAMVCLAYNIGMRAFHDSSVLRFHNLGQTQNAADAFLLWTKAKGKTLPGLVRRRAAERTLYLTNG